MKVPFFKVFIAVLLMTAAWLAPIAAAAQSNMLPPFRMTQAGGTHFKAQDLPKGKPVLLIYFSPDCDHCHVLMRDYFKNAKAFEKAWVVMITFLPIDKVVQFNNAYKVQQFTNLFVGTEGQTFFVRNHYKMATMPFVALHDKYGRLVQTYIKDIPVQSLIEKLKQL